MWILLVMAISQYGHSPSSQMSVEFNTKEACLTAAKEWQNRTGKGTQAVHVLCTPKG